MNKTLKIGLICLVVILILIGGFILLKDVNFQILNTKGWLSSEEKKLMIYALLLSVIIVVPVFAFAIHVAIKYRETNKKPTKYQPEWDSSKLIETIWWGIPILLILVLSVITWHYTHKLDPYKPLASPKKPVKVQVIAMQWKWLFIYPELDIASVNMLNFPIDTPVDLEITSDAPMNSIWIPQLSGQIYAMSGMSTQLHIIADQTGTYNGYSANISGSGFAHMTFKAQASSESEYANWINQARQSSLVLDAQNYNLLARQTNGYPVTYYSPVQKDMYNNVIMKYMPDHASMSDENKNINHLSGH